MRAYFTPNNKKVYCVTAPTAGYFSLNNVGLDGELKWENCRERFFNTFIETTPGFYYAVKPSTAKHVAEFIARIEELIELEKIPNPKTLFNFKASSFSETNVSSVLWIEPSDFWKMCEARRSLFTVFTRCALDYNAEKDNFEAALYSNKYVAETKDAVNRFLLGFREFKLIPGTTFTGWVNFFRENRKSAKKYLFDPNIPANSSNIETLF